MRKEELEKEVVNYLNENFCSKGSYCSFVGECKEGIRIRCARFEFFKNHLVNFSESIEKQTICKDLSVIKRENIALKVQLSRLQDDCKAYNYSQHTYQERITDLEKENAELKLRNQELLESCEGATMMYKDLQKAKELLVKWVELFKPKGGNIPPTPIQVDTEQFLQEVEK